MLSSCLLAQTNKSTLINKTITYFYRYHCIEIENYDSFRYNDLYIKEYHNYSISEGMTRLGLRLLPKSPLVVEPYLKGHLICDWLNESWNRVDWHNNGILGVGIRLRTFLNLMDSSQCKLRMKELHLDLFFEKLWINYLSKTEFYTGHRSKNDLKLGLQFWLSSPNPIKSKMEKCLWGALRNLWFEMGGSFYYSKSSFYAKTQNNFYLLNMNFKIERLIPLSKNSKLLLEPYCVSKLILDLGSKEWNKLDWHNNIRYGMGVRLKFYRYNAYFQGMDNIIFGPYFEYLFTKYWCRVTYVPSYRPTNDIQFGIELWVSINGKNI